MAQPCYIDTAPGQSLRHFSIQHSCLRRCSVAFLGTILNLFLPAPNSLQSPNSLLYRHILHSKNSCLSNSLPFRGVQSTCSLLFLFTKVPLSLGMVIGSQVVKLSSSCPQSTDRNALVDMILKKALSFALFSFSFLSLQWCMKSLLGYYTFPSKFVFIVDQRTLLSITLLMGVKS